MPLGTLALPWLELQDHEATSEITQVLDAGASQVVVGASSRCDLSHSTFLLRSWQSRPSWLRSVPGWSVITASTPSDNT